MKQLFCILFFLVLSSSFLAQSHCDGIRYTQAVFSEIDSTIGVEFGSNLTLAGVPKTLRMDVYYPTSEFFFDRPVVVLAFGGSFLTGARNQMRPHCIELAQRGFVAATIDYRLFDAFNLPIDSLLAFQLALMATGDMKAAVRWFREDADGADQFGIDPDLIYAGGISAGAIAALHLAYLDSNDYSVGSELDSIVGLHGGIRGNSSSNLNYSDEVRGIVNYSGALKDARYIDPNEPVLFSIHDEFDGTVPYGRAISTAIGTPVELWGSLELNREAREDGIRAQLITIPNSSGHVSYFLNGTGNPNYQNAIDSTGYFLEYDICNRAAGIQSQRRVSAFSLYPNPARHVVHWSNDLQTDQVEVISSRGDCVLQQPIADQQDLVLSELSSGIYTLRFLLNGNLVGQQRLVVR